MAALRSQQFHAHSMKKGGHSPMDSALKRTTPEGHQASASTTSPPSPPVLTDERLHEHFSPL